MSNEGRGSSTRTQSVEQRSLATGHQTGILKPQPNEQSGQNSSGQSGGNSGSGTSQGGSGQASNKP